MAASLSARRDVALTAGQRMVSAAVGIALGRTAADLSRPDHLFADPRRSSDAGGRSGCRHRTRCRTAGPGCGRSPRPTAIWLLLFPIVVSLALGFFGRIREVVTDRAGRRPSVMVIVGLACALFVIAWADPDLAHSVGRSPDSVALSR